MADAAIRILFVDDEPDFLTIGRVLLRDTCGWEIQTAVSAKKALELLKISRFDAIISDYRMPVMDGVEFLKEVYQHWPETVRIVLSGFADAASIVAAINDGHIYKFIPKPWNDDELRVTINHSLERYFLQKQNRELMVELSKTNDELERKVESRTAELQLRNQALTFSQSMLNALPVAVISVDSDGMIVNGSQRAEQIFNNAPGGFFGSNRREVLPEELNRVIDTMRDGEMSHLTWCNDGICYDSRIFKCRSFDNLGTVIVMVENLP